MTIISDNLQKLAKRFKQNLVSALVQISRLDYFKKPCHVWLPQSNVFMQYIILETPLNIECHFNPHCQNINGMFIPEWYVMTKDHSDDTFTCDMVLENQVMTHFTLYKNGSRLLYYLNENENVNEENSSTIKNAILETRLVGKKNSLFNYHYPSGIDVSFFGNKFFEHVQRSNDNVTLAMLLPFLLNCAIEEKIMYEKESIMVSILFDETFDEKILHFDDLI